KRAAFLDVLSQGLGKKLKMEQKDLERQAIVISGAFAYRQEETTQPNFIGAAQEQWRGPSASGRRIVLYHGKRRGNGWTGRGQTMFLRQLSQITRLPTVVEGDIGGRNTEFQMDQSAYLNWTRSGDVSPALIDELLANIEAQSQLHLKR